jgi:hypothetical protein
MKKLTFYFLAIALIVLTSMVGPGTQHARLGSSELTSILSPEKQSPDIEKGMITIKVKAGMKAIPTQKGGVVFQDGSLDKLSTTYKLQSIENRFRFNPTKMHAGLPDLSRIYRVTFPEIIPPRKVADAFSEHPAIEYAEPIPVSHTMEEPNDYYYYLQHHLPQIQAEEAWDIHKGENGTEETIIGIMDTGVDWDHEDLRENMWQNLGEDADGDGTVLEYNGSEWTFDPDDENGLDDDGNGYADDFIGWDFYNENNDPDPVGWEDHGSHCAGLTAARTNNETGVAGVSWNLKIMAMEDYTFEDAYQGIIYAAENGADVISNSWGHYYFSTANLEAIQYAQGLGSIIVAAASNDDVYRCLYPASYPQVVCVASVAEDDTKASYSNYGPNVTISAPGGDGGTDGNLFSTVINNYDWKMGTSMASPVAAGVFALVKSYHPDWLPMEVMAQVIGTADTIDCLNPDYVNQLGSGRVNAYRALTETGASLPADLKMDLFNFAVEDLDGDGIRSPGDTLLLSVTLQNFSFGLFDPEATFTLGSDDPQVMVESLVQTDSIPPNNYFELNEPFQVILSEEATPHFAEFYLAATSQLPIAYGDTTRFELFVAPDGIMVFQGPESGNAYSGQYIKGYLENNGLEVLFLEELPISIRGFDAVFMSLGNYGESLGDGTFLSDQMSQTLVDYLEGGGNLYLECGTLLGMLDYSGSTYTYELAELFGIADFETPLSSNSIDSLAGLDNSIAEGLYFTGTTQSPYWYIDILIPGEAGIAMLEENGYGTVAVQGEGAHGQRTVLMNYAISKLVAGEQGMTLQLMEQVCGYLGIEAVGLEEVQGSKFKVQGYPNPTSSVFNIGIELEHPEPISVEVFDVLGMQVFHLHELSLPAGEQLVQWNVSGIKQGIYLCRVTIGREVQTMKVVVR